MFSVIVFDDNSKAVYLSIEASLIAKKRRDIVEIRLFDSLKDANNFKNNID